MLKTNVAAVGNDMNALVSDAQALFQEATALTGEKADEIRHRGMELLNTALGKAQDVQTGTLLACEEMAASADVYVKENPWRVIASAAGVGLVVGFFLGGKY